MAQNRNCRWLCGSSFDNRQMLMSHPEGSWNEKILKNDWPKSGSIYKGQRTHGPILRVVAVWLSLHVAVLLAFKESWGGGLTRSRSKIKRHRKKIKIELKLKTFLDTKFNFWNNKKNYINVIIFELVPLPNFGTGCVNATSCSHHRKRTALRVCEVVDALSCIHIETKTRVTQAEARHS